MFGDLLLLLVGFGFGAIAAGCWVARRVRRAERERVVDLTITHVMSERKLEERLQMAQGEVAHWRRLCVAATAQPAPQRVDVYHHMPDDPSEQWKEARD